MARGHTDLSKHRIRTLASFFFKGRQFMTGFCELHHPASLCMLCNYSFKCNHITQSGYRASKFILDLGNTLTKYQLGVCSIAFPNHITQFSSAGGVCSAVTEIELMIHKLGNWFNLIHGDFYSGQNNSNLQP